MGAQEHPPRIEMKETTLIYEIPFKVRGIVHMKQIAAETTPHTTEHDAPSVTAVAHV